MKVLQVNCVYKKGSTGKITYDLHNGLLEEGIESVVCYGRGVLVKEPGVYKTCPEWYSKLNNALSRITGIMYGGCYFSTNKLISIIKKEQPDIVHLQCINGYFVNIYRLVTWLKENHIKTVLTLHAEFMYTANCGHALECERWKKGCGGCPRRKAETLSLLFDGTAASWKLMKSAFDGFDEGLIIASVSPWLMERAARSPILANKQQCVVYNGLDTNVFKYYDGSDLRAKHHCENKKVVFHATPAFNNDPNHIKGGYYVIELARRMPDVCFVVAGQVTGDFDVPPNMILLGKLDSQELLARYYSMADLTVLTSKRETFSMVCAESMCCGTPVVGFEAGAPEQIALKEYSQFVEQANLEQLVCAVENVLEFTLNRIKLEKEAQRTYAKSTMTERYIELYMELMHAEIGR